MAIAAHRWPLALEDDKESHVLLFPDHALVLSEYEVADKTLPLAISFPMIIGYPFREENYGRIMI